MASFDLGFLLLDTAITAAFITLKRYELPINNPSTSDVAIEVGGSSLLSMGANYLWMPATREVGIIHAIAGALLGEAFYVDILNTVVSILFWIYSHF